VPAYRVGLRASAEKQLAALDKPVRERVAAAIDALAETPRPSGAIARQGAAGLLRIRVEATASSTPFRTVNSSCW
jgi:mRNA interferase RelE/StbE